MFKTELELDADTKPDMWIVAQPLVWEDETFGRLVVPQGFRTDLASIPRALRNLPFLDPNGVSRKPAAAHDWLYAWRGWGKKRADMFLYAALLAEGASKRVAKIFELGVEWFGQSSWDGDEGVLETRDFRTPAEYQAWANSISNVKVRQ
jgi:hypothetical protein